MQRVGGDLRADGADRDADATAELGDVLDRSDDQVHRGIVRRARRDGDVPRVDGEHDVAAARPDGRDDGPVGEADPGGVPNRLGVPVEEVRARERRDERVARPADELTRRSRLTKLAVDDHADAARERRGVLEIVRHEQDGDLETGQQLLQLRADVGLRVGIERRERLVEQQHLRVAGQGAGERDALALSAGEVSGPCALEVPDPEAVEVFVGFVSAAVLDVLAHGQVREERVVLEHQSDHSPVRRERDAGCAVEPHGAAGADPARPGPDEAGDRAQHGRLPGARRPDQGHRRGHVEAQSDAEGPKRNNDLFEEEPCHVVCHVSPILRPRSRTMLIRTSTPLIASVASKFWSNSA